MRATSFFVPLAFALSASALDLSDLSVSPQTVCGSDAVDCNNGFCCSDSAKCDTSGTITKCGTNGIPAIPYGAGDLASAVESKVQSANSDLASVINNVPSSIAGEFSSIINNVPSSVAGEITSVAGAIKSFATAFPSSIAQDLSSLLSDGHVPTDAAGISSLINALPSAARSAASSAFNGINSEINSALGVTPTGTPKSTEGAAVRGASDFKNTALIVGSIWGAAAIGGAMLVL